MPLTRAIQFEAAESIERSHAWSNFLDKLATITAEAVYWGRQQEDKSRIWVLMRWQITEPPYRAVEEALADASTDAAIKQLASYTASASEDHRVCCEFPTTDISIGFFQARTSGLVAYEAIIRDFAEKARASNIPNRPYNSVHGWTVEDDLPFTTPSGDSKRGLAMFSVMGWPCQDAHWAFNETSFFKEHIGPVAAVPCEHWQVAHCSFSKVEPR